MIRKNPSMPAHAQPHANFSAHATQGTTEGGKTVSIVPSNIGSRFAVALQIPAGLVSEVRKQRVNTGLILRRIEDELGLAAFLSDRVVAVDRNLPIGIAIGRNPISQHDIINGVGGNGKRKNTQDRDGEKSLDESLNLRS
jgi:hypothetical protein